MGLIPYWLGLVSTRAGHGRTDTFTSEIDRLFLDYGFALAESPHPRSYSTPLSIHRLTYLCTPYYAGILV